MSPDYTSEEVIDLDTPIKANRQRLTAGHYHAVADDCGFFWIGDILPGKASVNTRWKCSKNHEWYACYSNIRRGWRDAYMTSEGWHVLRIKSGQLLPSQTEIDAAIQQLVNGMTYVEIKLPDWREI